jgi:nucleoside-diphosphate-sugar epimerase
MRRYVVTGAAGFIGSHLAESLLAAGHDVVAIDVVVGPAVPGDQRRTSADTTRIRSELGREPVVSLEGGLGAQWEWVSGRVAAR